MFMGVFAVTLQGLSKNGRGSREAGGEVAPFYVAKWHGAVHWYKFRNLIRRLRRHLLPFLEKALYARRFVTSNSPTSQNLIFIKKSPRVRAFRVLFVFSLSFRCPQAYSFSNTCSISQIKTLW